MQKITVVSFHSVIDRRKQPAEAMNVAEFSSHTGSLFYIICLYVMSDPALKGL